MNLRKNFSGEVRPVRALNQSNRAAQHACAAPVWRVTQVIKMLKAIPLGIGLALIVSLFIGSGGSHGGFLNVRHYVIEDVGFYWSWVTFLLGTGLSFSLMLMMGD